MTQGREFIPFESADQALVRAATRRFLEENSPEAQVRKLMDDERGWDVDVWQGLAAELGLTALLVPEEYGGAGASLADLAVVMEEMGRRLLCAPYLSSAVLSTVMLGGLEDEELRLRWLPRLADGSSLATVAVGVEEASDLSGQTGPVARSRLVAGSWQVSGEVPAVLDGATADLVLLLADTAEGTALFALEDMADRTHGVERRPMRTLDQTRRQALLRLSDVPATRVDTPDPASALRNALDLASVALAAEQAGVAVAALDMASEYVKIRRQFGRPIGEFQVIKHLCAEMLIRTENIRSCARYAARRIDAGAATSDVAALTAAYCGRAVVGVTSDNIQAHGGIGFTWEHPAHLYFKRAKASQWLLGSTAGHAQRVATTLAV
jgi:alkylation response protein AidB-like acyl-CoA dehydrogenase